jgi:hypothetical protein
MKAVALLASIGLAVLAGCGYSPSPASGRLKCGPMATCPDGYWCDGVTCWQNGQSPGDGGPRDGGGDAISANPADKFVGTWTFGSTVTRAIACTDGSSSTMTVGDYFVIAAGTAVPLTADYYCLWTLDLTSTGTTTVIRSGTSCSKQDSTVTPPVTYTWHGQTFTVTTSDGHTGTFDAQLPYDYQSSAGTGSCTMHFTGPVTK